MVAIKRPVCCPQAFIKPPPAAIDRPQKKSPNAVNAGGLVCPFRGAQNRQKQAEARREATPQPLQQTLFCGKSDK
jgi:hypothetical protein